MLLGYILSYVFMKISNDVPAAVSLTAFAAFFSFYIGHILIRKWIKRFSQIILGLNWSDVHYEKLFFLIVFSNNNINNKT